MDMEDCVSLCFEKKALSPRRGRGEGLIVKDWEQHQHSAEFYASHHLRELLLQQDVLNQCL